MTLQPEAKRQAAADAGRKYTLAAYADIWANDSALVARVRGFLGANFHWHDRLANKGSDLEVIQVLHDMVRGGSVLVIPENPPSSGSAGVSAPAAAVKKSFHKSVMEQMGLSADAASDYIDWYNAMVDRVNEVEAARSAIAANTRLGLHAFGNGDIDPDNFSTGTPTLLGDARPFEYSSNLPHGDAFDIAKTPNNGEPGTWYTNPGSGQMRLFGDNGKPVVDLDFDHVHNGLRPHAHNWGPAGRDMGNDVVPFSPWRP